MRNFTAVPLALTLAASPALARSQNDAVAYELAPVVENGSITALAVTIRLRGDADGETKIDWIDRWADEARLAQWTRDIQVEGAQSVTEAPNGGRIIRAAPRAPLTMRYRIVSGHAADPTVLDSRQAIPVVRPGWFYAVGEVLYALPDGRTGAPASFRWSGPANIGFASDTQHARGLGGRPRTVGDISESIAIGGPGLSVRQVMVDGAPLRIARIGRFEFDGEAFDRTAIAILEAERHFWRDRSQSPFLITSIPLTPAPNRMSYSGTGRSDAFAT